MVARGKIAQRPSKHLRESPDGTLEPRTSIQRVAVGSRHHTGMAGNILHVARVARPAGHFTMNLIAMLVNVLRRRPVPMTAEQITALATDADAFEETFGCWVKGPVILDEEDAK